MEVLSKQDSLDFECEIIIEDLKNNDYEIIDVLSKLDVYPNIYAKQDDSIYEF